MRAKMDLPSGYNEILRVDLKNKKTALTVHGLCFLISALMLVGFGVYVILGGKEVLYAMSERVFIKMGVMMLAIFAYIILHEAVHGIVMKLYGTPKVKFDVHLLHGYASAGSDCYYGKSPYIVIALAPVVFWGIVLFVIGLLVPVGWLWVVYCVQMMNVAGAAGDFYVTVRFFFLPKDLLVRDSGVSMSVYSASSDK